MINKIKTMLAYEKSNNPDSSDVMLLVNKTIKAVKKRINFYIHKDSTFVTSAEMVYCSLFPKKVLDIIISKVNPKSVLDVGCGTGVSLNYLINEGIDAWGIENSDMARESSKNPDKILKYNLNEPVNLNKKFDLVWCFEVIEHIHPKFESIILKTLTSHSSLVILSAAHPGQKGVGHFNEQPKEYWIEKFGKLGFKYDENFAVELRDTNEEYSENLMVFRGA